MKAALQSYPFAETALQPDEERELALAVRRGDANARDRMIRANLALVAKLADRFRRREDIEADVMAEGVCGLIRAVDGFDPSHGTRFSTYATPHIEGEMKRVCIESRSPVKLTEYARSMARKWEAARKTLLIAGQIASPAQVAEFLGLGRKRAMFAETAVQATHAAPVAELVGVAATPEEPEEDPRAAERELLRQGMATLNRVERRVISELYGLRGPARPLHVVAAMIRRGIPAVKQIQATAEAKLRDAAAGVTSSTEG
jgi:RNA polymerase primary sigma factor